MNILDSILWTKSAQSDFFQIKNERDRKMNTFIIALISVILTDFIVLVTIINFSNSKKYKPSKITKFNKWLASKIREFITNMIFLKTS